MANKLAGTTLSVGETIFPDADICCTHRFSVIRHEDDDDDADDDDENVVDRGRRAVEHVHVLCVRFIPFAPAADSYISAQKANICSDSLRAQAAAPPNSSGTAATTTTTTTTMSISKKHICAEARRALPDCGRRVGNKIDCLHVRGIIK